MYAHFLISVAGSGLFTNVLLIATRTNTKKKARSSSADDEEAADLYMSE